MQDKLIIHSTGTLEVLRSILRTKSLNLSYSKEDFCIGNKKISSAAHPMVCFCERNKDDLQNSTISYGKYGIAFSTDWAVSKRVSPVLYIDGKSLAAKGLATLLKARRNKETSKLPNKLRLPIMEIKCFTKNVYGYNSYLRKDNFDFKSEDEWRYVPRKKDIDGNLISQKQSAYVKNQDYYNNKLEPYPLKFKYSDIKNIFVSNKEEIILIAEEFSINKQMIQVSTWRT